MAGVAASDFIEWDVTNWSVALEFWARHASQDLSNGSALELGARHGGLSLWLALRGAKVVCSDLEGPSEEAVRQHREAGVSERIEYARVDATGIPWENRFDVVLFKSMLGAVGSRYGKEGQARAVAEMHRALRAGGELLFAENLTASPLHRLLRRRFVPWGQTWRYVSVGEMLGFLSPFRQVRYRTLGFAGAFGRTARQQNVLGRLDRMFLDRLVPQRWRYVIVGIARK